MSEEGIILERSLDDVKKEYSEYCWKAGQVQYSILVYQEELAQINVKLRELNQEASKLSKETN